MESGSAELRLEIGRIGRPHGLRGDVMVTLTTNHDERVAVGTTWWVGDREVSVESARPHQGRHIDIDFGKKMFPKKLRVPVAVLAQVVTIESLYWSWRNQSGSAPPAALAGAVPVPRRALPGA